MKTLIQKSIDQAMNSGADSCDVIVNSGESLSLSAQAGKIDKYKISKTSVLGIRIIKNKKIGLAYSESFDEDALVFATKSALENAEFSNINEYEAVTIKNPSDCIKESPKISDNSSIEEKIEFAIRLETEIKKRDSRVQTVPYNGLSADKIKTTYLNSLGSYTEVADNYLSAYTSAFVKDGELTAMHYGSTQGRSLESLDMNHCIEVALEHSINWLNARPVASGKYDIIFHPDVLSSLIGVFSNHFSAKAGMDKKNPWETKINHAVASIKFTLMDLPLYKDAFSQYHFDSEGMIKKDLTLIENGILKSFYHNTATANFYGVQSTGHAQRSARTSLSVQSTNWYIKPGVHSDEEVTLGSYLEIISVMGLGSGANSISGEFSFGASGYICKDGKRIRPVKEITVAGNFSKLLFDISKMGIELQSNTSSNLFSPLIRFSELYVAGK